jgi:hypothetical protein
MAKDLATVALDIGSSSTKITSTVPINVPKDELLTQPGKDGKPEIIQVQEEELVVREDADKPEKRHIYYAAIPSAVLQINNATLRDKYKGTLFYGSRAVHIYNLIKGSVADGDVAFGNVIEGGRIANPKLFTDYFNHVVGLLQSDKIRAVIAIPPEEQKKVYAVKQGEGELTENVKLMKDVCTNNKAIHQAKTIAQGTGAAAELGFGVEKEVYSGNVSLGHGTWEAIVVDPSDPTALPDAYVRTLKLTQGQGAEMHYACSSIVTNIELKVQALNEKDDKGKFKSGAAVKIPSGPMDAKKFFMDYGAVSMKYVPEGASRHRVFDNTFKPHDVDLSKHIVEVCSPAVGYVTNNLIRSLGPAFSEQSDMAQFLEHIVISGGGAHALRGLKEEVQKLFNDEGIPAKIYMAKDPLFGTAKGALRVNWNISEEDWAR